MSCLDPWTIWRYFIQEEIPFECVVALGSVDQVAIHTLADYLQVFVCTLLLEAPFYLGYLALRKQKFLKAVSILIIANLATHPIVTFLIPQLGWAAASGAVLKEVFAPAVEAAILKGMTRFTWLESVILAIVANLFSWWIGALF